MKTHVRTKVHKRRLKELKEVAYTVEESEQAAGMGNYQGVKKIPEELIMAPPTALEHLNDNLTDANAMQLTSS